MSLINLNAFEILKLFNSNKISTVEYVSELISHIKLREPNVEAWAFLNEDLVKSQARKIDEKRSNKISKDLYILTDITDNPNNNQFTCGVDHIEHVDTDHITHSHNENRLGS